MRLRRTLTASAAAVAMVAVAVPASTSPDRLVIGRSVQGRELSARFIGNPNSDRTALVVGCMHGDECAGKRVVRALLEMDEPTRLGVWVVWDINPDGSARHARQNARGVDLNRNFPHEWQPSQPGTRFYSGTEPASEPETRAIRDFILDERPDVTIWYHQPFGIVIRSEGRLSLMRRYSEVSGLPLQDYRRLHGTAVGWQNHRFPGKTAFVVELPSGPLSDTAARRHARAVLATLRLQ